MTGKWSTWGEVAPVWIVDRYRRGMRHRHRSVALSRRRYGTCGPNHHLYQYLHDAVDGADEHNHDGNEDHEDDDDEEEENEEEEDDIVPRIVPLGTRSCHTTA